MNEQESTTSGPPPGADRQAIQDSLRRYWRSNVAVMAVLITIWAIVGLGCGVLFADDLNQYKLLGTGYPLGFWFAQQGSIIAFVVLILVYCILLNKLDKKHHDELEALGHETKPAGPAGGEG